MSVADREAETLRALRVSFVAGVPGSGPSYELLDACTRAGIPFVPTAHEAAAAMMSGAAARQAGGVGAALSIKGPGVANITGGIALARFENYPLITFAEAYPPDAAPGLQHKRLPQDEMVSAIAKGVFYRGAGTDLASLATLASAETPGPVHLNLVEGPANPVPGPLALSGDPLARIVERIRGARRPIVICGSAVTRIAGHDVNQPAIAGFRVPVFSTAAAKGAIDEHDPSSAGVYTAAGAALAPERALLPAADLVIGIGLRNSEVLGARAFAVPYVSVDVLGIEHQLGFEPELHHSGDLREAIRAVAEAASSRGWGLDLVAQAHAAVARHLERPDLLPASCYATLAQVPGGRLVTDSGNFTIVAEHVWRAAAPCEFVGSSNGRFMGAALPQAIGAALQNRSRPTICTAGDGGLPPFIAEVKIAVERRLPILLVLMTDGYYGSMRARVTARGFTDVGVRVTRPSWRDAIAALGCDGVRVATRAEFDAAVMRWTPSAGPYFIEAAMPDGPYLDTVRDLRA
jgi:acetolactate synthase-1/2/3 large subunit